MTSYTVAASYTVATSFIGVTSYTVATSFIGVTSYTVVAGIAVLVVVLADLLILRTALVRSRTWWTAYGIVVFFQLVTNGWLTGRGIVRYSDSAILGSERIVFLGDWRVAFAPVEDLAFGFALVLLSCALWVWTGARMRAVPTRKA